MDYFPESKMMMRRRRTTFNGTGGRLRREQINKWPN
jgi:hypothetical protein